MDNNLSSLLEEFYSSAIKFKDLTESLLPRRHGGKPHKQMDGHKLHQRSFLARAERRVRETLFKPERDRNPARRESMQRHRRHSRTLAAPKAGQFKLPGSTVLAPPALRLSTKWRIR